jgi:hypothetical protein
MIASATLRRAARLALPCLLVLVLAGCFSNTRRVEVVQAAPSEPVQEAELAPPEEEGPEAPIAEEGLPGEGEETQVASLPAADPALDIGRTDLLGGWTLASGGETCQLFMSLTQWTGGYRASTRGCSGEALAGISAWELDGTTVTLKGGEDATPVASVVATAPQQFSGATTGGAQITVSR